MVHEALDLAGALSLNYPEFPDSCRRIEFSLLVDVLEVLVDGADVLLEQLSHELLGEPDGLVLIQRPAPSAAFLAVKFIFS